MLIATILRITIQKKNISLENKFHFKRHKKLSLILFIFRKIFKLNSYIKVILSQNKNEDGYKLWRSKNIRLH